MISITDSDFSRCKAACEFLANGKTIQLGDYGIRQSGDGVIEVTIPTKWKVDNQTDKTREDEISEAKQFIRETGFLLPILGAVLSKARFSFQIINDYGMGAVALTEPTRPHEL